MKKTWMLLLVMVLILGLTGCGTEDAAPQTTAQPDSTDRIAVDLGELVVLYTSDLNGVYAREEARGHIGYSALAAYAAELEDAGHTVVLVDGGDAFEGGSEDLMEIADTAGYDIRVPGELELSRGVETLLNTAEDTDAVYVCCNLIDKATGGTVFEPYTMVTVGEVQVAFVGITTPTAEVDGSYDLCGGEDPQAFYDRVQQAVDGAADAGADYVIAVGHLGTDMADSPWTSVELIANTTGLAAFLDGHSGAVLEGYAVTDKDDFEIPVCAAGSEFCYVGRVDLHLNDGTVNMVLLDGLDGENSKVQKLADELTEAMKPTEGTAPTETAKQTAPTE